MISFRELSTETEIQEAMKLSQSIFDHHDWLSSLKTGYASLDGLIEEDGTLIGFILIYEEMPEAEIGYLTIRPEDRSKGSGKYMLSSALTKLKEDGYRRVLLEVRASNSTAIKLYERAGFRAYLIRRGYYSDGEDAICYEKEL